MSDDELILNAKRVIELKGIGGRTELKDNEEALYQELVRRKLTGRIGLPKKRKNWREMDDAMLVAYAKSVIRETEIDERTKLKYFNPKLYDVLCRRKLVDEVFSDAGSSSRADAIDMVLDALGSFGDGK